MITPQSTIVELKAEAYTVLQNIERFREYLKQLNQMIAQKEDQTKPTDTKKDDTKVAEPAETVKTP